MRRKFPILLRLVRPTRLANIMPVPNITTQVRTTAVMKCHFVIKLRGSSHLWLQLKHYPQRSKLRMKLTKNVVVVKNIATSDEHSEKWFPVMLPRTLQAIGKVCSCPRTILWGCCYGILNFHHHLTSVNP